MMASTLQFPGATTEKKKKKEKKHSKKSTKDMLFSQQSSSSSPIVGGDNTNNNRKRKQQQEACQIEVAPLYLYDLGLAGVKNPTTTSTSSPKPTAHHGPILKGPEQQKFQLRETPDEKIRRLKRKVCFWQKKEKVDIMSVLLLYSSCSIVSLFLVSPIACVRCYYSSTAIDRQDLDPILLLEAAVITIKPKWLLLLLKNRQV